MGNALPKSKGSVKGTFKRRNTSLEGSHHSQAHAEESVIIIKKTQNIQKYFELSTEKLGQGRFGVTRVATDRQTNVQYACKTISKKKLRNDSEVEMLQKEVAILHLLKGNENIIEIFDVFEDRDDVHIIMELCTGGELFDSIVQQGTFSEYDAACMLRAMLKVIAVLHDHYVIHRDLKPENFLLSHQGPGAKLKAIDFGVSKFIAENEVLQEMVGSIYYIAPEVLQRHYSFPADIWSAGVILYILLCGEPPFCGHTNVETIRAILDWPLEFKGQAWGNVSEDAKDCIRWMLERDPDKRPEARDVLEHKWLKDAGIAPRQPLHNAILKKMERFAQSNKLKRVALKLIAGMLPDKETEGLRTIFEKIDKDADGWISLHELKSAMREKGNVIREYELYDVVQNSDLERRGAVSYQEFVAANLQLCNFEYEENIRAAFDKLDEDGNGYITRDELSKALELHHNLTEEEIDNIVDEVDVNGDGNIDYPEFLAMIKASP